jgi:hypothetical protein
VAHHSPRPLDTRVETVADNMRVDAATAEVVEALSARGIEPILLKGPSIARWLYPEGETRAYKDCDLLIAPAQTSPAVEVLAQLGFQTEFEEEGLPDWWLEHASSWWRRADGVVVDLHRTLPGIGVADEVAWRVLTARTDRLPVAGYPVRVLAPGARALHVALHAMHHGERWHRPVAELERAVVALDDGTWQKAVRLAEELDAVSALATGLTLAAGGAELAERLGIAGATSTRAALLATTPPPVALGIDQLVRARGVRTRAAIMARKLVPPAGFMRRWHPIAARSRIGLVAAYLYRPVWILLRSPAAFRAWRRARRAAQRT